MKCLSIQRNIHCIPFLNCFCSDLCCSSGVHNRTALLECSRQQLFWSLQSKNPSGLLMTTALCLCPKQQIFLCVPCNHSSTEKKAKALLGCSRQHLLGKVQANYVFDAPKATTLLVCPVETKSLLAWKGMHLNSKGCQLYLFETN